MYLTEVILLMEFASTATVSRGVVPLYRITLKFALDPLMYIHAHAPSTFVGQGKLIIIAYSSATRVPLLKLSVVATIVVGNAPSRVPNVPSVNSSIRLGIVALTAHADAVYNADTLCR